MKRIKEYKKLFNIESTIDLQDLKKTYRNLVKEWHPDKFQEGDERAEEAKVMSLKIIDAYHFLISIAPETREANLEAYTKTTTESGIENYKHKGLLLEVSFTDGSTYEYFGVNNNVFNKFLNASNPYRFAKRNIFHSFLYRKSKKDVKKEESAA
ncbi:KTSC domain-containing protein [Fulvivirga ligni]|uniref:KTSC domain-containing protein n=1 Tax=Fulvivirga ligni TaxID=2904246 RepID=UPI001F3DF403|nr:KTSC domain-containing protein [Fulvivirga ligni]UII20719.1 KTSC domain-containing protein [Fulvivirga ligni]